MNLFDLFVKIGVDDQASDKIGKISSWTIAKGKLMADAIVGATKAIGKAFVDISKIGFNYNKQIETYTTNFEVMMGDAEAAARKVEELKEMGAKTPFELGDLANATQTLLAFNVSADESTGVLSKLGDISLGNVQKLESLTRAYGKMNASQKVTLEDINMMIDAGFNPLLIVAENTGETMEQVYARISKGGVSFDEITSAINQATSAGGQFYQGMEKASQTTEGLISTLKDNATALVGEVFMPISEGLTNTVLPSAINAVNVLSEAFKENGVNGMIAAAGEMLGSLVNSIVEYAPKVVDTAVTLVNSLIQGLSDNQESIATGAIQIITSLATGILNMLPKIAQLGLGLIVSLENGIADSLPTLIPTIMNVILQIVDTLTDPKNLSNLLQAALSIITQLAWGLVNALPDLIDAVMVLIENIVTFLIDPQNLAMLVMAAIELIVALGMGIIEAIPKLMTSITKLVVNIVDYFVKYDWGKLGKNLVDGFKKGIQNAWANLKIWFKNLFGDLIGIAKKILGIASPSKVFKKIGGFTAEGFGEGFEDEFAHVKDDMEDALNFDDASVGINSSIRKVGAGAAGGAFGGTSIGNITINVDGAKYSDEQSLASAIALEIQNMTDRRAAVYA